MISTASGIVLARQHTRIHPLAHDDARVLAQFPGELAVADIHRVNPPRAARQQHIGKAAGRGADIKCDPAGYVDAEMIERMGQLDAAARNPWMVATFDCQRRIGGEPIAGLVDPPIAGVNKPGKDQRLRLGPALRQPALDQ